MSIFSDVTGSIGSILDSTVGWAVDPYLKIGEDITGISPSDQIKAGAATGAVAGTAAAANGTAAQGSIFDNLFGTNGVVGSIFGSGDGNSNLMSSIFGTGENSLSSILGSVVKGAVGIGTSYFENQQYLKDQKKLNEQKFGYDKYLAAQQYKYDTAMADEAYQRDVAMWKMQNKYNAPAAQMARLESAGLNPNLVYGGGSVTGNTAGSAPSYHAPSYPQVQYPSSQAQKLDIMRNVLGIFDEYQSIKNQALENQRANARIALQAESMRLTEKRLDLQEKNEERRFQIMLANLGLARDKETNRVEEVKNNREDKKNAPTATQKEFNWIADMVGDAASYPIYYSLKYLDWLTKGSRERRR